MTTDSNPKSTRSSGKPGIEGVEKYLLHTRREIIPLLKSLGKKPDLITARIPDSSHTVITAVLDLLPNKNLIVLDYGPSELLNNKLLAADRIICTTRHEMVDTRFNCDNLKRVKYKGEPAFAAPIPSSVMYLQRRDYFRIKPPISHPAYISMSLEDGRLLKLKIIDIGVKGLSLEDKEAQLKVSGGERVENCKLTLPANPSVNVNMEIRYMSSISLKEDHSINRVGGRFINLNQNEEFTLQRFINMVQIEQNTMLKS